MHGAVTVAVHAILKARTFNDLADPCRLGIFGWSISVAKRETAAIRSLDDKGRAIDQSVAKRETAAIRSTSTGMQAIL